MPNETPDDVRGILAGYTRLCGCGCEMNDDGALVVYVLTREYDYEGESPIGVYDSLETAQAHGTKWLLDGDHAAEWREGGPGVWCAGHSPTMWVRREVVEFARPTPTPTDDA